MPDSRASISDCHAGRLSPAFAYLRQRLTAARYIPRPKIDQTQNAVCGPSIDGLNTASMWKPAMAAIAQPARPESRGNPVSPKRRRDRFTSANHAHQRTTQRMKPIQPERASRVKWEL